MKSVQRSFLFFCLIIIVLSFNDILFAQQKADSIRYYSDLSENANNKYDASQSFNFFEEQLNAHINTKNILGQVSILTSIAQIQMNLGMVNESERMAVDASRLLDKITYNVNQDPYRVSLYNHFGILYYKNANFQTSLKYYERALELVKDSTYKITAVNNLANVYREKKDYETAIRLYKESLLKSFALNDSIKMARTFNNLGKTQSLINNSEAIDNLTKGLSIRKEINFDKGVISSYISLGEHFKRNGNLSKALDYANKALTISKTKNRIQEKIAIFELQCGLGHFDNYNEFKKLKDSINTAKNLSANLYVAIKYDQQKAINRANRNELEKEKEKTGKITSQAVGLIILMSSIFLYFLLKSKHKKDKLQQVFITESRISKKVHDEVANDVFQVMTKLQSTKPDDELIDDIEQIYNKTRDISKEHSVIDLEGDFEDVLNDLILSFNDADTNVIAKGVSKVTWDIVSELKRVTIYKVLQELLINMKKHSDAEIVVLTFDTNRKTILINYSDNGKGCNLKKGTGLQNVENRIASINGTITFDSETNKGFKAKLKI